MRLNIWFDWKGKGRVVTTGMVDIFGVTSIFCAQETSSSVTQPDMDGSLAVSALVHCKY